MSYVSLLKSIPEALSQPTGIAAIAAVGVHGAIALIVPLMPVNSSQPQQTDSSKTVGLVEISPADQNRLPQTPEAPSVALQPQLPIQQLPQQQLPINLGNQPPTVLTPGTQLPIVPSSGSTYRTSYNPRRQNLQSSSRRLALGNSGFQVNPNYYSSAAGYSNRGIKLAGSQPLNVNSLPQQSRLNNQRSGESLRPIIQPADIDPTTTAQSTKTQISMIGGDNGSQSNQNQPGLTTTKQPQSDPGKLALAGPSFQQDTFKPKPVSSDNQNGGGSSETKIASSSTKTFAQQITETAKAYPGIEFKKKIAETVNKPGLEGEIGGSLVVDSEGKIDDLKFIDNSVSPALQAAAREYLREYFQQNPPGTNGKSKLYPFALSFQSRSNNQPEQTSEKKPTPSAEVKPKSQPVTEPSATPTTTPSPTVINTQPGGFSTDTAKKLIERLREGKKETEQSSQKQ
jgi:hypothetical protein